MSDNHLIRNSKRVLDKRIENLLSYTRKELAMMKRKLGSISSEDNLDKFYELYERFLYAKESKLVWDKIEPPPADKIINYSDTEEVEEDMKAGLLEKLAVLKLNGGLGTTMGCVGPKSAIEIRSDKNFLDLCVKQVDTLHKKYKVCVPLILMNSFNTERQTNRMIYSYKGIKSFSQSVYPRISADTYLPVDLSYGTCAWYPPGHGDIFQSLLDSGTLDELLNEGKEYLFVSNIDNLAATVDFRILDHMIKTNRDFLMEVTNKTRADIKGGTLINYEGALSLLEIAQVPPENKKDFTSVKKFRIFNTNSVWINLKILKELLKTKKLELDIIKNKKKVDGMHEEVIQLETAIGAAIKYFPNSAGIIVPRTRFYPVKTCSDLFLVQSNLFTENGGGLAISKKRVYQTLPLVKLIGPNFNSVVTFQRSFKGIPDILELDHLTVSGNVRFGKNVTLKGTVIIIADDNSSIQIPDGAILEDNILYGNLPIIDH